MRPTSLTAALLLALTTALFAAPVSAHRVAIFAWAEGNTIHTESGFGKDNPVKQGTVEVRDNASNQLLLSGRIDGKGLFSFAIPESARQQRMDLKLVVQAGEGHRGDWLVMADEYLPPAQPNSVQPNSNQPLPELAAAPVTPGLAETTDMAAFRASLVADMEALLDAKLAPVKRELAAANQAGPGLAEIVGGIGWLIGLAGIAAYFRSKK